MSKPADTKAMIEALRGHRVLPPRSPQARLLIRTLERRELRYKLLVAMLRDQGVTSKASADYAKVRGIIDAAAHEVAREKEIYGRFAFKPWCKEQRAALLGEWKLYRRAAFERRDPAASKWIASLETLPPAEGLEGPT